MREILFRGKTLTGRWVEGAYYKQEEFYGDKEDAHIIITSKETLGNDLALESHIVIPETVGQYTGLTDKNETKIFEGDIVRIGFEDKIWETAREVVFEEGQWFFKCNSNSMKSYIGAFGNSVVEVIGNIHDKPELLGGNNCG